MQLTQLAKQLAEAKLMGNALVEISAVTYDSRQVQPGSLFVAVLGFQADGHDFISHAISKGAAGLVVQANRQDRWRQIVAGAGLPTLVVPDSRRALSELAAAFHDHPSRQLGVIGVTGTDGKTSVVHMTSHILQSAGWRTGMISTAGVRVGDEPVSDPFGHTTPEAPEVQSMLARMVERRCQYAVIESSSHGLALRRLDGCDYDVAVLTNVGKDHLDFHRSQDAYMLAKARLFMMLDSGKGSGRKKVAILNVDDPSWHRVARFTSSKRVTYGIRGRADVQASRITEDGWGCRFLITTGLAEKAVRLVRPGEFNVYNALAATAVALSLGMELDKVCDGLESWLGVPGRLELIEEGQAFRVVVDYAHAPDSLRKLLELLRRTTSGRLIALFGAAGERSPERRQPMGEVSAALADYTILTDDDPRGEDPEVIIDQIADGLVALDKREGRDFIRIRDRYEAVARALDMASDGDTVLLAGKGHERTITIGDRCIEHDDREIARRLLRESTSE